MKSDWLVRITVESEVLLNKYSRRDKGDGTIRLRSDGRWEARYSIGYDPKTGKQIQKSIYGKTKVAVKNKLNEILQDIENDEYIEPNHIKLGDWLDTWIEDYSFDKKYSTLKGYKAQIKKHIKPVLGKYYLNQISPVMVQHFYNSLSRPDDEGRILSPKSIKNVHTILQAALNQAVENEYIKKNPCAKARLPKVEKAAIKPLEEDQIKLFLERAMADEVYGTIMKVILFTGLREGEAMGLTWDCVDFSKGTILIEKQLQRRPKSAGGTVLASVKNGKPRLLKPAPTVMQLLKVRYTEQIMQSKRAGDAWMAWKNEEEHAKALVFTNDLGDYMIPKRLYLHFKKIAAEAGAPNARVHDLRHTYAVLSLQNGDDVKTVQNNLGHSSAAFTLDVYGHVSDRMRDESSRRMEDYIQRIARA